MKKTVMTMAALAGSMTGTSAAAATFMASEYAQPRSGATASASMFTASKYAQARMTYTTIDQVNTSRTNGYSGVGSMFISRQSTATTGLGGICTGALVGGGSVLTAAHCLDTAANDPITGIQFFLPSLGAAIEGAEVEIFRATEFALHPDYAETGLVGGNDVALFTIDGDLSAYDSYGLFEGFPLGEFDVVGTGTIGGPQGTNIGIGNDYQKRVGSNIYELFGDQLFSDSSDGVVLYDFDDGTAEHDVFGRNLGQFSSIFNQTGIENEASSSPGDSGGPSFINGQIAAVTSFGITGGIFDGFCGGDSTDPFNRAGDTTPTELSFCTNSSVGEIGGNTLVSANRGFIDSYLAGTAQVLVPVPEPSTWMTMLLGFFGIGASLRRRKKTTTRVSFA